MVKSRLFIARLTTFFLIAEGQSRAKEAGGIEIILEAMRRYINDVETCFNGCAAIVSMLNGNSKQTLEMKQIKLVLETSVLNNHYHHQKINRG